MRQSFTLMSFTVLAMPIEIVTNIVVTRYMGAEDYGNYQYIGKVIAFLFVILNFGLLRALNRNVLLAKNEPEKAREFYGLGLLLMGFISLLISVALTIAAFVMPNFEEKGIVELTMYIVPFVFVYIFAYLYEQILPANNQINLLIIKRIVPVVFVGISAGIIYYFFFDKGLNPVIVVWTFFLGSQLLVYLYILLRLRPRFNHLKERLKDVYDMSKSYSFNVYIGDLFSTAFTSLMPLLISWFSLTNMGVGFYSLATVFSSPLSMVPTVIATSHYSSFVNYKQIPRKIVLVTVGTSLLALIGLWIIIGPFINWFYTEEYQPVILLTIVTSVGTLLYGFSDFLSRYLSAKGDGVALRNSSFIVGFTALVSSLIMIYHWQAMGFLLFSNTM